MIWLSSVQHDLLEAVSLVGHPLHALEASLGSSERRLPFPDSQEERGSMVLSGSRDCGPAQVLYS